MTATSIARLHVTLDDVKPLVQRRIEVRVELITNGYFLRGSGCGGIIFEVDPIRQQAIGGHVP